MRTKGTVFLGQKGLVDGNWELQIHQSHEEKIPEVLAPLAGQRQAPDKAFEQISVVIKDNAIVHDDGSTVNLLDNSVMTMIVVLNGRQFNAKSPDGEVITGTRLPTPGDASSDFNKPTAK
jgi:hypothetical protein